MYLKNEKTSYWSDEEGPSAIVSRLDLERTTLPCSLHELAPYIGKMRPELAAWTVDRVSKPGDTVLDPFCGSGTVMLEAALKGRVAIGLDLNPYACLIAKGKSEGLARPAPDALVRKIERLNKQIPALKATIKLDSVPSWVSSFYHPETLRELLSWVYLVKQKKDAYLLSCLLAIAHHQRPGFLSYPASHTVPYLRTAKFPRTQYPELYEYREVFPRLIKKAVRSARRIPITEDAVKFTVKNLDGTKWRPRFKVDAIVTSPPYMGQLHYARDNRLRLWLMGEENWEELDSTVSPFARAFVESMVGAFNNWSSIMKPEGVLAVLVGDTSNSVRTRLDVMVADIARRSNGAFELSEVVESEIPDGRRTRKGCTGSKAETLLVLRKGKKARR